MVVGEYTGVLYPSLANRTKAIALVTALLFALLQWRGVRWGSFTQNLTSLLKVLAFAAFVLFAFLYRPAAAAAAVTTNLATPHRFALLAAIIIALQGVLYTYD